MGKYYGYQAEIFPDATPSEPPQQVTPKETKRAKAAKPLKTKPPASRVANVPAELAVAARTVANLLGVSTRAMLAECITERIDDPTPIAVYRPRVVPKGMRLSDDLPLEVVLPEASWAIWNARRKTDGVTLVDLIAASLSKQVASVLSYGADLMRNPVADEDDLVRPVSLSDEAAVRLRILAASYGANPGSMLEHVLLSKASELTDKDFPGVTDVAAEVFVQLPVSNWERFDATGVDVAAIASRLVLSCHRDEEAAVLKDLKKWAKINAVGGEI
jgi:hypothetical protein